MQGASKKQDIQVYTDSLSMIKKSLITVLDSEWDILSALHRALKYFRTPPTISWVKSHQDEMVYDDKKAMPLDA